MMILVSFHKTFCGTSYISANFKNFFTTKVCKLILENHKKEFLEKPNIAYLNAGHYDM